MHRLWNKVYQHFIYPIFIYYISHLSVNPGPFSLKIRVFHISVSRWFFTGFWVTASSLKSPGFFSVLWPFKYYYHYYYHFTLLHRHWQDIAQSQFLSGFRWFKFRVFPLIKCFKTGRQHLFFDSVSVSLSVCLSVFLSLPFSPSRSVSINCLSCSVLKLRYVGFCLSANMGVLSICKRQYKNIAYKKFSLFCQ